MTLLDVDQTFFNSPSPPAPMIVRQSRHWKFLVCFLWFGCIGSAKGDEGEDESKDPKAGTPKFRTVCLSPGLRTSLPHTDAYASGQEPHFYPENFTFSNYTHDQSLISPGFLFIAPLAKFFDWGPQIYDNDGVRDQPCAAPPRNRS